MTAVFGFRYSLCSAITMATTLVDLVSLREISQIECIHDSENARARSHLFESVHNPERMGNMADVAYGGNTLAVAFNAALQTVPSGFFLYSALGNYLGPAFTDRTLQCSVREIRNTKTFATRHVELSQVQKDGKRRLCLFLSADFQAAEPATLLTYSRSPMTTYSAVEHCRTMEETRQHLLKCGLVSDSAVQSHRRIFGISERFFDRRPCPEGFNAQTLNAMAKKVTATTQDHLSLPSRTSADHLQSKHLLKTPTQHIVALAWLMGMGSSTIAPTHTGRSVEEVKAQSTLDFALRIFAKDLDLNAWSLKEYSTLTGGDGRTYAEGQLWDSRGKMLCSMTQQCILRPKLADGDAKL